MRHQFHSTPVVMKGDVPGWSRGYGWALPASGVLHLLVGALLIFGLPVSLLQPEKEEAIAVTLVPPPEKPRPKPAEKSQPKPADVAKPEPAKASPPEKATPPKPDVAKPEPAPRERDAALPLPTLRPVFQFGEKDAGPRDSTDGNGAKDSPGEAKSGVAPASVGEQESGAGQSADRARNPSEKEQAAPTSPTETDRQASAAPPTLTTTEALDRVPENKPTAQIEKRGPAADDADGSGGARTLREAKTLFFSTASGGAEATTAIGKLPREVRAGQLCASELDQQLRHAWPPIFATALPNYLLKRGNVLEVNKGAFLADRRWFNLAFRCEVDQDARKVVSFAIRIGAPILRNEWASRNLTLK
jgi:hypothetical protein